MFTVTFRLPVAKAGRLMGDLRVWLDRRRAVATAFHCRHRGTGVEIEISFDRRDDATACATEFEGLQLALG